MQQLHIMDPLKCIQILEERSKQPPNSANDELNPYRELSRNSLAVVSNEEQEQILLSLKSMPVVDLISFFRNQQSERVQVYKHFHNALANVMEEGRPDKYPAICTEATQKFSQLSNTIKLVQETLEERGFLEIAGFVKCVQAGEKEKLLLVAAQHLDKLQDAVELLGTLTGGKSSQQQDYLEKQIAQTEGSISDALENIQAAMCDTLTDKFNETEVVTNT